MRYVYRRTRPRLVVEMGEGRTPFNCYSVTDFTVTSTYPLDKDALDALFATGAIGYGQQYRLVGERQESEQVACVGIDGERVIENPRNPYSGKPYQPIDEPVYIYQVETTCDSGD